MIAKSGTDVPNLLKQLARARGSRHGKLLDELYASVLHEGTVSAESTPAAAAVIEFLQAAPIAEKTNFYVFLNSIAEAARYQGDEHSLEIQAELLKTSSVFVQDLQHSDHEIRREAASLLGAFEEAAPEAVQALLQQYFREAEDSVCRALLEGLIRIKSQLRDWPGFLSEALYRESTPANRFLLLAAEIETRKAKASPGGVAELVTSFNSSRGADHYFWNEDELFFRTIRLLGSERELNAMLDAFAAARSPNMVLVFAERLLRLVFADARIDWDSTSVGWVNEDGSEASNIGAARRLVHKLLPKHKPKGMQKIDYCGVKGFPPQIPDFLSSPQRKAIEACLAKAELWAFRTNLWQLFGLPDQPETLRQFLLSRG